jgi:hypothetical protein
MVRWLVVVLVAFFVEATGASAQSTSGETCNLQQYNSVETPILFEADKERALLLVRDALSELLTLPIGYDSSSFIPLYRTLPVFCRNDQRSKLEHCSYLVYERKFRSTCQSLIDRDRAYLLRFSIKIDLRTSARSVEDLSLEFLGASSMPLWPSCQEWDVVCRNKYPRF